MVENPTWNFPSLSPFVNINDLDSGAPNTVTYSKVKLYISFYSSMGTLVHSTIIQALPNQIDVSSLLSGNYIMTIKYLGQIETHDIQII